MDLNVDLPSGAVLSKRRFESNERFQKQGNFLNDSAFFRMHRRKLNQRMNPDSLSAFLQEQTGDGLEMSSIDKLMVEEISYNDLASLTDQDLNLMGFKYPKERAGLLQFFAQLPNQDPTFDELCNQPEAQKYNSNIIKNASAHLMNMEHSLIEANYKIQVDVPDDVLVGEKYFASRFLTKALDELLNTTDEIDNELEELSKVMKIKRQRDEKPSLSLKSWILIGLLVGVGAAFSVWIMKSHQK